MRKFIALLLVPILLSSFALSALLPASNASAVSGSSFDPGQIIDDIVFYNSGSMSSSDIQRFLESKVPNCDTNGSRSAADWGYPNITHAQLAQYKREGTNGFSRDTGFHAPPYTCLRDFAQATPQMEAASGYCAQITAGNRTAAQIIKDVAVACGINPQVLIVLLEKEQSLVTDNWPLNRQYNSATGFACPDTAPCNPAYNGFFYQVYNAARQFKVYQAHPNSYNYVAGRSNRIYWQTNLGGFINPTGNVNDPSRTGQSGCGYQNVFIKNQATAALYIYTPYQPNERALSNLYGTGDGCSAYGNRNFWRIFSDWFGSTRGAIHNGVDYSPVFNDAYYLAHHPDVNQAAGGDSYGAFRHFIEHGMKEGRQASQNFNVTSYRNANQDLRIIYGTDLTAYYIHYALYGKNEGRIATGDVAINYITTYNGIDYRDVYDFIAYKSTYSDINQVYGNDDAKAIQHFATQGISEARQGSANFNVRSYQARYYDLRRVLGDNLKAYYLHFITNGKAEGRIATGNFLGGITNLNGIDYSPVYSFNDYSNYNPDIRDAFKLDDKAALHHFVNYGMNETRRASSDFDVQIYKARYSDLRNAFGDNIKAYYLHYITNGKAEGRIGK